VRERERGHSSAQRPQHKSVRRGLWIPRNSVPKQPNRGTPPARSSSSLQPPPLPSSSRRRSESRERSEQILAFRARSRSLRAGAAWRSGYFPAGFLLRPAIKAGAFGFLSPPLSIRPPPRSRPPSPSLAVDWCCSPLIGRRLGAGFRRLPGSSTGPPIRAPKPPPPGAPLRNSCFLGLRISPPVVASGWRGGLVPGVSLRIRGRSGAPGLDGEDLSGFETNKWRWSPDLGGAPAVVCAMRKLFFSESACKETKLHSAPHSWLPLERGKLSKFSGHAAAGSSM
jgi:hypothetical protein